MKNAGLGRGLGALLGDAAVHVPSSGSAVQLRLSEIEPNQSQPRKRFDESALADLAESIRQHGVLTPLLVRRLPSGAYQIIAGERRWRAARMAGLTTLPAVVHEADDRMSTELALIENLQREDLNPLEIAEGYRALVEEFGLTQEEVAGRVGKSRPAVANSLRLLALPRAVHDMLADGSLSEGHARTLLALPGRRAQETAAGKMIEGGMSVRQAEAYVKALLEKQKDEPRQSDKINYLADQEKELTERWGRKVSIAAGRKKGAVTIEFYDADDLEELISRLMGN